ncbi:MAG: DMT family transporter [Deltaproteobacteria bacterium]|nr:DMT family transporter [Deltaproteobacteria bacterium]MBI3294900.1 DMT family transporter [Deltaproteobacteria bacterium]
MPSPTSGRWKLGFLLALLTMVQWSFLPLFLKILAQEMNALTICWYRFIIASVPLIIYLRTLARLPSPTKLWNHRLLILGATVPLIANYILYLQGLHLTSPSNGQVIVQLGPLFLGFGGLVFFGERYNAKQWLGVALITGGLALFFRDQLTILFAQSGDYVLGSFLIVLAAITWAIYALCQKRLLAAFSSPETMLVLYLIGIVITAPWVQFSSLSRISPLGLTMLILAGLNTLLAYGAFAESLAHWDASRISAVLALSPITTLLFNHLGNLLFPHFVAAESFTLQGIVGALIVVAGSMLTALSKTITQLRNGL